MVRLAILFFTIVLIPASGIGANHYKSPTIEDFVAQRSGDDAENESVQATIERAVSFSEGLIRASTEYELNNIAPIFCIQDKDSIVRNVKQDYEDTLAAIADKYLENGQGGADLYGVAKDVAVVYFSCKASEATSAGETDKYSREKDSATDSSQGVAGTIKTTDIEGVAVAGAARVEEGLPMSIVVPAKEVDLKYDTDLKQNDYISLFKKLESKGFAPISSISNIELLKDQIRKTTKKSGDNPIFQTAMALIDFYGLAGPTVRGMSQYELFEKAADYYEPIATFMLASAYFEGNRYYKQDKKKAFELYTRAARTVRFAPALNLVGSLYGNGLDGVVERDIPMSFAWLVEARRAGSSLAIKNVDSLMEVMTTKDMERATELLRTGEYIRDND